MSGAFVIRNQLGHYWGKAGSWVTGGRAGQIPCRGNQSSPAAGQQ